MVNRKVRLVADKKVEENVKNCCGSFQMSDLPQNSQSSPFAYVKIIDEALLLVKG